MLPRRRVASQPDSFLVMLKLGSEIKGQEANNSRRVQDLYQTRCRKKDKLEEYGSGSTRREHSAKKRSVVQKFAKFR